RRLRQGCRSGLERSQYGSSRVQVLLLLLSAIRLLRHRAQVDERLASATILLTARLTDRVADLAVDGAITALRGSDLAASGRRAYPPSPVLPPAESRLPGHPPPEQRPATPLA